MADGHGTSDRAGASLALSGCGRQRLGGCGGRQDTASQEAVPIALVTPAGSQAGQENVATASLDAQGHRIAIGTAVVVRKDKIEEQCCCDAPQDEEAAEHKRKNHQLGHIRTPFGAGGRLSLTRPGHTEATGPLQSFFDACPELDVRNAIVEMINADLYPGGDSTPLDLSRADAGESGHILIGNHSFPASRDGCRNHSNPALQEETRVFGIMLRLKTGGRYGEPCDEHRTNGTNEDACDDPLIRGQPPAVSEQIARDTEHDEEADRCRLPPTQGQSVRRWTQAALGAIEHEPNRKQHTTDESHEKHVLHGWILARENVAEATSPREYSTEEFHDSLLGIVMRIERSPSADKPDVAAVRPYLGLE